MTELDVTLTDYAIMLLCVMFLRNIARRSFTFPALQTLWLVFFGSVAVGSLTGGTVHGFFLDESSVGFQILWPVTFLALGVTASSAWVIAGLLGFGPRALKVSIIFSIVSFVVYAVIVLAYSQSFVVVIFNYLPPMIFLLLAAVKEYRRTRARYFLWITAGIGISFIGAYVQQAQIASPQLLRSERSPAGSTQVPRSRRARARLLSCLRRVHQEVVRRKLAPEYHVPGPQRH